MKKFIVVLGLFITVSGAMADNDTNTNVYIEGLINEMKDTVENTIFTNLDSEAQSYINRIKYMRADKQEVYKLFFFSERLLWRVYDDYVAILDQKSKETGRKLDMSESNTDGKRHIEISLDDTGVTDAKCMKEFCDYPDGFELCFISMSDVGDILDGKWEADLLVLCDDQKTNQANEIRVLISADLNKNEGELFVKVSGFEGKFDEMVKYRQEEVALFRYNAEQVKKYGNKAVLKDPQDGPFYPKISISSETFTRQYSFGTGVKH